jgi:NitT/TauT family transport system permease protein
MLSIDRFRTGRGTSAVTVLAAALALWELAVWLFEPQPFVLPAPSVILAELYEQPILYVDNALHTLTNTLVAFGLSVVIGVGLAIGIVYSRFLENTLYTLLVALNSIPKVALAPLFVIWLGTGAESKVAIAFLIAIFAIVIDAVLGLRSLPPDMQDLGRSLRGSPIKILVKIRFPNALPSIFAGMKVAISLALVGAIVGEFVAAQRGLGYVILSAQGVFETQRVFAAVIVLAILGTTLFYLLEFAERKILPWHVSQRGHRSA